LEERRERSNDFLRRLRSAIASKKMNRFALSGEAQLRQGAETELYWSSIFLKYAADLKVGRFLPTKIEP